MEMNLTGNPIKADQALQAGLVSKVCKPDELLDEAHKTAATVRLSVRYVTLHWFSFRLHLCLN